MNPTPDPTVVAATYQSIIELLAELGHGEPPETAILVDDRGAVLTTSEQYRRFSGAFAVRLSCIPYPAAAIEGLTIRQFCELYARESYPDPPTTPLPDDGHRLINLTSPRRTDYEPLSAPICFVLGCGRSGTTLFRAMLDAHDELWAPGEMHLAQFDTMDQRATQIAPALRHMLVPEVAARFGEDPAAGATRLAAWENTSTPVTDVYQQLHAANPGVMIVDKTPPYSMWPAHLDWLATHFPNARYVHIIRSPHDVIRSMVRMQLHKGTTDTVGADTNPYQTAEVLWVRHNENINAFLAGIADHRKLVVRYEDLTADPSTTLRSVTELVDLTYDPAMANPYATAAKRVAIGAGDPGVNFFTDVQHREARAPFYPTGERCRTLAAAHGY